MLPYYEQTAEARLTNVLAWEAEYQRSREAVTILAGDGADRELELGTVLGARTKGDPVITAGGENTGDGMLGELTLKRPAMLGVYSVVASAADTFMVFDPDGRRLADAKVGETYDTTDLTFEITAGATPFEAGDSFEIEVPEGDGKVVAIDFDAVDGTAEAFAVLIEKATAPDGEDAESVAIRREAVVVSTGLVWPDGATDAQKNEALATLAAAGILEREGV